MYRKKMNLITSSMGTVTEKNMYFCWTDFFEIKILSYEFEDNYDAKGSSWNEWRCQSSTKFSLSYGAMDNGSLLKYLLHASVISQPRKVGAQSFQTVLQCHVYSGMKNEHIERTPWRFRMTLRVGLLSIEGAWSFFPYPPRVSLSFDVMSGLFYILEIRFVPAAKSRWGKSLSEKKLLAKRFLKRFFHLEKKFRRKPDKHKLFVQTALVAWSVYPFYPPFFQIPLTRSSIKPSCTMHQ